MQLQGMYRCHVNGAIEYPCTYLYPFTEAQYSTHIMYTHRHVRTHTHTYTQTYTHLQIHTHTLQEESIGCVELRGMCMYLLSSQHSGGLRNKTNFTVPWGRSLHIRSWGCGHSLRKHSSYTYMYIVCAYTYIVASYPSLPAH